METGQAKAARLRAELKRYGKRDMKVQRLLGMGPDGRKELKRMRDVRYFTDKPTRPGEYLNPTGKRYAKA